MKTTRTLIGIGMVGTVCLGLIAPAAADTYTWNGSVGSDWFAADNWTPAGPPAAGDTAIYTNAGTALLLTNETPLLGAFTMRNGTLTCSNWFTRIRATDVAVDAGTLTLPPAFANAGMSNRVWVVCSNFTLGVAAVIDADDRGYLAENGPGRGWNFSGAGHGGRGAMYVNWSERGWTYGAVAVPLAPGSGGASPARSRSGGGAVRIEASGEVAIHGAVNANGGHYKDNHGAGGSGGSIFITCQTFAGSTNGLLSVRGGNATGQGGAGGGGRIAIVYDGDAQSGVTPVNAGVRFSAAPGTGGTHAYLAQPGTLFLPDVQFLSENLTEQWDDVSLFVPGMKRWRTTALHIAGRIGLPGIDGVMVTNDLVIAGGGRLSLYGAATNTPALEDGMHLDVGGALTIADGGRLVLISNPSNGAPPYVTCQTLTVETGGHIDADYRGFASTGAGDGVNNGPGGGTTGAGHGGFGSMGETSWTLRGAPYGNPEAPIVPGSGGGVSDRSGFGGGAVIIQATDTATIRGTISANGQRATRAAGSGGSGGAIYLRCRTFHGDAQGFLSAKGGKALNATRTGDGYGAGGRIAVVYDPAEQAALPQPNPAVRFSTAGSADDDSSLPRLAETGTLYLPNLDQLFLSSHMTEQWDDVDLHIPGFTTWQTPTLEIGGRFAIRGLEALTVDGDFTVASGGRFTLYSGHVDAVWPHVGARIDVGGVMEIRPGATLLLCATNGVGPYIECGSLWVQADGHIRADARGDNPGKGAGAGTDTGGGGYGGAGALTGAGQPYGEAFAPVAPGSGGGLSYSDIRGGRGGGLVRISARGAMRVDGTIRADGMQNSRAHGGAGSGGAVLLTAARFSGMGALRAAGGNRVPGAGGGGGGGRIAVWRPFLSLAFVEQLAAGQLPGSAKALDPAVEYPDLLLSIAAGTGGDPAAQEGSIFFGSRVQGTLFMVH